MAPPSKEPPSSEITPFDHYLRRRELLKRAGLFTGTAVAWGSGLIALSSQGSADRPPRPAAQGPDLVPSIRGRYAVDEALTSYADITTYNNYYELGLAKTDPAEYGHLIRPRPWTLLVDGEVEKPMTLDLDAVLRWFPLEERVYRMRCVEAWSMVIPWLGFPLGELIRRVNPTSRAKFVELTTLLDPQQLPGQINDVLPWPYVEGLRIDEATHPLAFLAIGLYGKKLLGQNGAPLRLVVPWKYGFKGAKSIVKIRLTSEQPKTTWNRVAAREYGFYANVNPGVDHPRWSQAEERRIGELSRRPTLPFNGYAEQVASLYTGMDLTVNYELASGAVPRTQPLSWLQPAVVCGSLLPLLWLALRALGGSLGANPIATALNQLGLLALIFLWACLACTPLKILFNWNWPIRLRKTLGLLGFFTALLHFAFYLIVDQGFALGKVLADVGKRPFIAVGFLALVLLVPLALTSTKKALQRLGFKTWKRLHRLIYVVAVLGFVHFLLRVKTHDGQPLAYGAVLGVFFAVRLADFVRQRRKRR